MSEVQIPCVADRTFTLKPATTALLVIDMQRHFLTPMEMPEDSDTGVPEGDGQQDGGSSEDDLVDDDFFDMSTIIPNVARLVALARGLGVTVIHTREGYSPDMSDVSTFRRDLDYVGHPSPLGRSLIRGEPGHDFVEQLRPLSGEAVIDKASFGAFFRTDLDDRLRAAGITHLLLCGVTTQCCVHSTLREAVDHGYWCLTVADCCAASEPALHDAALQLIVGEGHLFGWIADVGNIEDACR